MFCNVPGSSSEEVNAQNINVIDDETVSEGDAEQSSDLETKSAECSCSSGYCKTDWKPSKDKLS